MKSSTENSKHSYSLRVIPTVHANEDYFLNGFHSDGGEMLTFRWLKKEKVVGVITFGINSEGQAMSIPKAPFGGFWLKEAISSASLQSFIQTVLAELKNRGAKAVTLTQAPKPYESSSDLINYLLYKDGFKQVRLLSHHFYVGKGKGIKPNEFKIDRLSKEAKKQKLEIHTAAIGNFKFLEAIRKWNSQRGYEVAMDDTRLIQQISQFPERYFLITVCYKSIPVAYTLAVKLTSNSFYYYLSAIDPNSTLKNGGELMLLALFKLAVTEKVSFIDLGSSDLESFPNHPLMFFKSKFANDVSNKITWTKTL